jgi:hypothetical protein
VVLQRFDGSTWRDVARFRTTHDADVALDRAMGDGEAPGSLRIAGAAPSMAARALMIVGAVLAVAVVVGIVWLLVAGG